MCDENNDEIIAAYNQANKQLDIANAEIEKQIKDIATRLSSTQLQMSERQRALERQIEELQSLKLQ
jgi:flagellar capping protein FliD